MHWNRSTITTKLQRRKIRNRLKKITPKRIMKRKRNMEIVKTNLLPQFENKKTD
jgi:hypothetical protein